MTTLLFARAYVSNYHNINTHIEILEEHNLSTTPTNLYKLFNNQYSSNVILYAEEYFKLIYDWDFDDKIVELWGFLYNDMELVCHDEHINSFLNNHMDSFIFDLDDSLKIAGTSIFIAKDKSTLNIVPFTVKDFKNFLHYVEDEYFRYDRNEVLDELKLDVNDIKNLLEDTNNIVKETVCIKRKREDDPDYEFLDDSEEEDDEESAYGTDSHDVIDEKIALLESNDIIEGEREEDVLEESDNEDVEYT